MRLQYRHLEETEDNATLVWNWIYANILHFAVTGFDGNEVEAPVRYEQRPMRREVAEISS
ncbi:MAG: hypothetical protein IPJ88_00810 [Myxococcales bacterium]|nr:MAG: hypothetical protein IPJ88_00810 [Myxococcales bacterium]